MKLIKEAWDEVEFEEEELIEEPLITPTNSEEDISIDYDTNTANINVETTEPVSVKTITSTSVEVLDNFTEVREEMAKDVYDQFKESKLSVLDLNKRLAALCGSYEAGMKWLADHETSGVEETVIVEVEPTVVEEPAAGEVVETEEEVYEESLNESVKTLQKLAESSPEAKEAINHVLKILKEDVNLPSPGEDPLVLEIYSELQNILSAFSPIGEKILDYVDIYVRHREDGKFAVNISFMNSKDATEQVINEIDRVLKNYDSNGKLIPNAKVGGYSTVLDLSNYVNKLKEDINKDVNIVAEAFKVKPEVTDAEIKEYNDLLKRALSAQNTVMRAGAFGFQPTDDEMNKWSDLKQQLRDFRERIELKEDVNIDEVEIEVKAPEEKEESEAKEIADTPDQPHGADNIYIANTLNELIVGEWDTIKQYNDFVGTLEAMNIGADILNVIKDITAEEHEHIGQLQQALLQVSPNTEKIASGEAEGQRQIDAAVNNGDPAVDGEKPSEEEVEKNKLVDPSGFKEED